MLRGEWDMDEAKLVWQEEAREEGREETLEEVFSLLEQGVSLAEAKERLGLNQKEMASSL